VKFVISDLFYIHPKCHPTILCFASKIDALVCHFVRLIRRQLSGVSFFVISLRDWPAWCLEEYLYTSVLRLFKVVHCVIVGCCHNTTSD